MVGYKDLKKVLKLHTKKRQEMAHGESLQNGSEIITWMGHSFKTKSTTHPEQHFYHSIFKITSFLNFKLQIIRLAQEHSSCMPTH